MKEFYRIVSREGSDKLRHCPAKTPRQSELLTKVNLSYHPKDRTAPNFFGENYFSLFTFVPKTNELFSASDVEEAFSRSNFFNELFFRWAPDKTLGYRSWPSEGLVENEGCEEVNHGAGGEHCQELLLE